MPKGNFWDDTGEQLMEMGISTAKATVKGVVNSLNPLQPIIENTTNDASNEKGIEKMTQQAEKEKSTPLNFQKLQQQYADQDKLKIDSMRKRLFDMVKNDEEKAIAERKRQKQERLQKELEEEQLKKQKEQQMYDQTPADIPHGKIKRTIGAAQKKVATDSHQEIRANKSSG